jgi:LmbE family N-acetylglucosaminyl deacetylase
LETDLVPYQASLPASTRGALVVAPHADDETFGCGGTLAAHVAQGVAVHVVVLTDGAEHGDPAQRQQECRAACAALGCAQPEFWGIADRQLAASDDLARRLADKIAQTGADLLYAPSPWEVHPDHRAAAQAALHAAQATGVNLAFYEVGSPLRPNVLVDITAHLATKQAAMACYVSQQAHQDYAGQIAALNRYRTYTLPSGVQAAEAFTVLGPQQLAQDLPRLLQGLPVALPAEPAAAAAAPLVSVLIRSIDRATLQQALDSVALQTYPNIEVVVVAAKPGHGALPPRCGPYPLRLVPTDTALQRSQTANRALASAQGELLLLLDDDDWLLPSHIARLAKVLAGQPDTLAAYAGVAFVDAAGKPNGQTMDLPFDGARQLAGNLTPIHSVLFRKALVALGCRFDERLDRYEDWDFWLQAAAHTVFAHVPGVSAVYRIHESSGVHQASGPESDASRVIYDKWQAALRTDQVGSLMQRAWTTEDLQVQNEQAHAELARRDAELAQLRGTLHQLALTIEHQRHHAEHQQARIDALHASLSWRITAPLRWVRARLGSGG